MGKREKFFNDFCKTQFDVYKSKNDDYGDSFVYGLNVYGKITFATRVCDKYKRIESLAKKELKDEKHKVKDESFDDTVSDLFNYCWMYLMWEESKKQGW